MGELLIMIFFIFIGVTMMSIAIFSKKKELEDPQVFGATDLFGMLFNVVFNVSTVSIKRILLFVFGLLWTILFVYIFIMSQ